MSKQDPIVSDEELEAFVDARLDASQRARVAACLDACPKTAEAVTAHRRINAQLCAHFDGVLGEVVPSSLLRTASQAPRAPDAHPRAHPRAHRSRVLGIAAGIAAIGLLGGVAGWWWRDATVLAQSTREFVREAAFAHQIYAADPEHPVEFSVARRDELLAWLSRHLGTRLKAPRLAEVGFHLLGGRLLPASDGPAGQLMYESAAGERITLYLRADLTNRRELEFQFASDRDLPVLFWLDGPRGYALAGDLERGRMLRLAKVVYDQLGS
jgi:anti-sigma factor RsiW